MAEWRQCTEWLIRCQIMSREHKVASENARVQDLANLLKDGVLICNLLNRLNPETLDQRDFSQRPQLSQFLCNKNINVFLQRCSSVFKIKNEDLFVLDDLANLENFGKVLHTLSVLSQTPLAQKSKIEPFSLTGRTPSMSRLASDLDSVGLQDDDDDEDDDRYMRANVFDLDQEIYGCLVDYSVAKDLKTKTKRDFCIEEIVETEKNYVEALEMINTKFMKPLKECKDIISPENCDKIFMGNEKLLSIHREFLELLHKASGNAGDSTSLTIPDCFMTFKEKFLFYGEFCSKLTHSQELLYNLCQENASLQKKIMECQKAANEGKFKLHDLLAVPMQRVLKYHLLISELMKNTDEQHSEKKSLERALDEMQDLSLFVNEVRRDHEMLNAITLLQKSITGLPVNIVLPDWGRNHMDGEMKVKLVSESTAHTRHLFLFDKRLLICKPSKNDVYVYKTSLLLSTYKLDETKDKTSFQLQEISGNTYVITGKTPEIRNKWRNGILLAQDNICPQHAQNKTHDFQMTTFNRPTICDVCRKFFRGIFFQGYHCQKTKIVAHKACLEKASVMDGPPKSLPPRSKGTSEKAVAINSYSGIPSPPLGQIALKFNVGDTFDVIGTSSDPSWAEGEFGGRRGQFPKSYVKFTTTRKPSLGPTPSYEDSNYINAERDCDITSEPWYAGQLTREQATEVLEKQPKGTYVVRRSADGKQDHAISIQCDGVKHMKIGQTTKNGQELYFLVAAKSFHSISELIQFHSRNSLESLFPEVKTPLIRPLKSGNSSSQNAKTDSLGFCVAKYDYVATASNHLSMKRGDRIEICSKSGEERGWWKGSLYGKTGFFPKSYVKDCDS